jgi:group I intron endonuclease
MRCIYKIISASQPSKFYIGSAVWFRRRRNSHRSRLAANTHHNPILQNHVNKYGLEDLLFEIVELVDSDDVLLDREQFYLDTLNPPFNICHIAGNTLGTKRSPATCKLLSELKKGNTHNVGRKLSAEHKASIQKANKGKSKTEEHKQKLRLAALSRSPEVKNRYREARVGKRHSEETKKKISAANAGSNNPRWKGGIGKDWIQRQKREAVPCESL